MKNFKMFNSAAAAFSATVLITSVVLTGNVFAGEREQAKRIHERLTGLPPSEAVLNAMATTIQNDGDGIGAALDVMNGVHGDDAVEGFLGGTLKRMAAPWTNRDQDPFEPLNDYMATFIGLVDNGEDLRQLLYEDVVYVHPSAGTGYSPNSNAHYAAIESDALPLADLQRTTQSSLQPLPANATAGIMTTRAGARAFFYLGTNRAMLRFTLMSQLCRDLEQLEDTSGVPDRIRQDVSRSPGGDSRLFLNGCVGCHIGMDPLAQAFAYYDYVDPDQDPSTDNGTIDYNTAPEPNPELGIDTRVHPKYHINANNFPHGFVTPDDSWDNYWRQGQNANLGWNWGGDSSNGSGSGAKSMGIELANSYAFAQCQVEKVFEAVCLREPATTVLRDGGGNIISTDNSDVAQVEAMTNSFRANNYNLKQVFAETADYCAGN